MPIPTSAVLNASRALPPRWMTAALCSFAAGLLIVGSLLLAGCGDSDSPGASAPGSSATQAASPQELADAIVDTWSRSMQDLVALLEERPTAPIAMPQVEQLRESYIQELVTLGKQRETLSEADRATLDSLEMDAMFDLGSSDWYQTYQETWDYYSMEDLELANIIASFNTLAQYSDFGLLAQQLPDEAARLGVQPSSDSTQN